MEQSQQQAEEQNQQQAEEQSQQQAEEQSEPQDCDRDKAKYDEKHFKEKSCSQPVPKHPRTDAEVQEGQYERKLGEVFKTIPTIDFNVETVENKNLSFTVQKDTEVILQRNQRGNERRSLVMSRRTSQNSREKRRLKDLVNKHSEAPTIQTAQKQRLRKSRRP